MLNSLRTYREKVEAEEQLKTNSSKAAIGDGTEFLSMIQNDHNVEI